MKCKAQATEVKTWPHATPRGARYIYGDATFWI